MKKDWKEDWSQSLKDWVESHSFMTCRTCRFYSPITVLDWNKDGTEEFYVKETYVCKGLLDNPQEGTLKDLVVNLNRSPDNIGCELWEDVMSRDYGKISEDFKDLRSKGLSYEESMKALWPDKLMDILYGEKKEE